METVQNNVEVVCAGGVLKSVVDVVGTAGTTTRSEASNPVAEDHRIPDPSRGGDLTSPGPLPTMEMPIPIKVSDGGQAIRAPGQSHPDNPAVEVNTQPLGTPNAKPVWSGDSQGPNPPAQRSQSHPALR
jgi:hypothetical protein